METIKIADVLKICSDFIKAPTKENQNALNELQQKLVIKSYLPLAEKTIVLFKIMNDSDQPVGTLSSVFTIGVEVACFFDGLLAYTNIDNNIDLIDKTYENYDCLQQSGMADYILQYCERDYGVLVKLMDRTINYHNLIDLMNTLKDLNLDKAEEFTKQVKEMQFNMDSAVIKDMADILRYNNPNLYKLEGLIEDEALDKVLRADRIEKIKKQ